MQSNLSVKKQTYKPVLVSLIGLSIPTILEEILSTLLQYVDTAMVGRLGEKATAAVSTTTTIGWLIHSVPGAMAVALLALASKANGAGDEKKLKKLAGQSVLLAFISGAILEILSLVLSPFIPVWMGVEPDIVKPAGTYFTITSITLILRTSSRVFAAMIRSVKDTKSPMYISVGENVLNVFLNILFIYKLGLGVTGAAIASCISFGTGGAAMFIMMLSKPELRPSLSDIKPDLCLLREVFVIGLPALGTTVLSCSGYIVFAGMVSGMGTTTFAAHSIAITAEQIVYIPGYGLRAATSTLVGNALGEGDIQKLKATEKIAVFMTIMIMIINGALLYIFALPFMQIFTNSAEAAAIGSEMLKLVSFSEPFFGLMIVLEGISFGMGRTNHIFVCESASMWGIRILFTFFCVKIFGLGLTSVWLCMIADNVVKSLLLWAFRPGCEKL
ncbi:MAG: MATE family efflux transporter [Oscillospiraceae bacterium]|nr:MATE family efflux transporter [Oscillospiraceae bacterium]